MTKLIPQDYQQTNDNKGSRNKMTPQDLASGTYFGQMQLRGSILVIKDNVDAASGFISFGTSITTIPTSAASGTGVYIDYSGIYGNAAGVSQFYLQASDGKAYAGAGAVTLDGDGVTIEQGTTDANAVKWKTSGTTVALLQAKGTNTTFQFIVSPAVAGTSANVQFDVGGTHKAVLYLYGDGSNSYANLRAYSASTFLGFGISDIASGFTPSSLLHLKSTAPTFRMEDSTASAKSLLVTVDSNLAKFEEAGGAANNLLVLDLANARVGIGTASPASPLHIKTSSQVPVSLETTTSNGVVQISFLRQSDSAGRASVGYANNGDYLYFGDASAVRFYLAQGGGLSFADGSNYVFGTATGTKIGTATTQKLAFWNATPIVRPSAYTQTYATANKTLNADGVTDPAAYAAGANGYSTGAMASAVHAAVIALHADLLDTKQMLNAVIDDLQAIGLLA